MYLLSKTLSSCHACRGLVSNGKRYSLLGKLTYDNSRCLDLHWKVFGLYQLCLYPIANSRRQLGSCLIIQKKVCQTHISSDTATTTNDVSISKPVVR